MQLSTLRLIAIAGSVFLLSLPVQTTVAAKKPVIGKAGPITHKPSGLKVMAVVPAKWTIKKFRNIAKPKPAPSGYLWYAIRGVVINNSKETRSVNSTTFKIVDSSGSKYKPDPRMTLYLPAGTSVVHIEVKPGESKRWMAFFPVSIKAKGLRLLANDLTFGSKSVARFKLPDPTRYKKEIAQSMKLAKTSRSKSSTGKKRSARSVAKSKSTAATTSGAPTLVWIKDAKMGYTIKIPKGAKNLLKLKFAHTYDYVLKGGMYSYNVNLIPRGVDSLQEAVKEVTTTGQKKIASKKTIPGGFEIIKQPRASVQEIWVFRKGPSKAVAAKCSGPASGLKVLREICESLKVN